MEVELVKEYHENGKLEGIGYKNENGKKEGEWKFYHETGELYVTGYYVDGKKHGEFKDYYTDGTLECIGVYNHGYKVGEWKSQLLAILRQKPRRIARNSKASRRLLLIPLSRRDQEVAEN